MFEFNQDDKVSHLGQRYTWYGVNGVQYNVSSVSRRVLLGSVEEWTIVNQRLGRGEGAEGCDFPPRQNSDGSTTLSSGSRGVGSGGNGVRRRRRLAVEEPAPADGRRHEQGESNGEAEAACRRAGPGKVTADGHPFHLHTNHFQVG